MKIMLKTVNDIYTAPDKNGNQKCIKKAALSRKAFEIHEIDGPEEMLGKKGEVIKGMCRIKYKDEYFTIKHTFDEILKLTSPIEVRGFRHG